jgi:2-phosphosulfolactate phosphatase
MLPRHWQDRWVDFSSCPDVHRQASARARFDWGLTGAAAIGAGVDVAVVVDVLSFSTTTTVALDAGATVIPFPWRDERAEAIAREHDAVLAVGRSRAGVGQVSLSPASMRAHVAAGQRVVLPSPNGATIAHALADAGITVVAGCLRNAAAVADWLRARDDAPVVTVAVVAAGERWPDGSLRPAAEDLWGAGAVLAGLDHAGLSAEAAVAATAYEALADVPAVLHACASGLELDAIGFEADVDIAAEVDASRLVPVLRDGVFVDASTLAP